MRSQNGHCVVLVVVVSKGFTSLKPLAFTAPADEPVHNLRSPVADKTKIAQMIFGGFEKCLYPVQKFQSDPDREHDAERSGGAV